MTFDGTLYQGMTSIWKIRVSPNGVKDSQPEELFKVWMPNNGKEKSKRWIFYNPKIAFIIQYKFNNMIKYYIPVSMFYALKDTLKVMYNRVLDKDMYTKINGKMYLNESKANENKVKLTMFSDSLIFTPVLIEYEANDTTNVKRGIKIESTQDDNKPPINIDANELKTLYEVLNHLDINTYSLILSLIERMSSMDQKLDNILDTQHKILKLVEKENIKDIKNQFTVDWSEIST